MNPKSCRPWFLVSPNAQAPRNASAPPHPNTHILYPVRNSLINNLLPPTRLLKNMSNIRPQLRHPLRHLPRQHIPKTIKRAHLPLHRLITLPCHLYELSCVDIWIAAVIDVVDEFLGDGGEGAGRRGLNGAEVGGEVGSKEY